MSTSDLNDATTPGPEGTYPSTPGEFAARWNAADEAGRERILQAMNTAAEQSFRCVIRRHEEVLALRDSTREHLLRQAVKLSLMSPTSEKPVDAQWVTTSLRMAEWMVRTLLDVTDGIPVDWEEVLGRNSGLVHSAVEHGGCRIPHPSETKRALTPQEAMDEIHAEANEILRQALGDQS